jgi:hypothetical protein
MRSQKQLRYQLYCQRVESLTQLERQPEFEGKQRQMQQLNELILQDEQQLF